MSYGKLFSSTFSGSMVGLGPDVFSVWAYVVSHAQNSQVELNPILLGAMIGMPSERAQAAISVLEQPDAKSRNKAEEGRRLVKEGEFAYRVVSHSIYREMRNEDARREYNRTKQQESRDRRKVSTDVNDSQQCQPPSAAVSRRQPPSAQAESEAESEAEAETEKKKTLSDSGKGKHPRKDNPEAAFIKKHKSKVKGTNSDRIQAVKAALDTYEMEDAETLFENFPDGGVWHNEVLSTMAKLIKDGGQVKSNPFAPGTPEYYDYHVANL